MLINFLISILLSALLFSPFRSEANPGDNITWDVLKPSHQKTNANWSPLLLDIMNHEAPEDHNTYDDLVTLAHETSHGIHAFLRNSVKGADNRLNGFYVLNNQAIIIAEPNIKKSVIGTYVPESLRGSRYSLYLTDQTVWEETPLYVWDEWNAYINGGAAGVDLVQNNLWKSGWRDAVSGIIEFVVYALASGQAVKEKDPDYFRNYIQFKEFLAWNLKRSMKVYLAGSKMPQFKWDLQDAYYQRLINSTDAEPLRTFARETFGTSWTRDVLGF